MKSFSQTSELPGEVASFRRALFLATGGGLLIVGLWLLADIFRFGGVTLIEGILLVLFAILFGQLAFGFAIAFWGFVVGIAGGDRWQIMNTLAKESGEGAPGSTAVVMPIFNEDPGRVFRAVESMFRSIEAAGGRSFDFFVLSDSNHPDNWIQEECAWMSLCSRLRAFGRIFYRKRRVSIHGKSGNIADFCRRWGKRYRYLIILDADSVMTGECLVRLARVMDANPGVGIVQTAPRIVRGKSLLQRLIQFGTQSMGPLFAAGSNFWHLAGGSYWGHNAIIRLQPFMEYCVLPELPGRSASARRILSHDTVEAALMQQAGYQVWFAYLEPGSYEETPPNLSETLRRDRRWCQGNLQHFWFLFAPRTRFANRIHMFFGLMAYLTAPLLLVFIALGAFDYYGKEKFAVLSARTADPIWMAGWWTSMLLLALTLGLLFLPKVLGLALMLRRADRHGGPARVMASGFIETAFSVLLAPIFLYFHTRFVVLTLVGFHVGWKPQNRSESTLSLRDAVRMFGEVMALGILVTALLGVLAPTLIIWVSPILLGWIFAIPVAMLTSSEAAGRWFHRRQLLVVSEEHDPPAILERLDDPPPALVRPEILSDVEHYGLLQVIVAPYVNSIHASLLRRSRTQTKYKQAYLDELCERLLMQRPSALSRREMMAILWSPEAIGRLHRDIWRLSEERLHPWWRFAMRHYNEAEVIQARLNAHPAA